MSVAENSLICVIDLNLLAVSRVYIQMVVVVLWASVASYEIADESYLNIFSKSQSFIRNKYHYFKSKM